MFKPTGPSIPKTMVQPISVEPPHCLPPSLADTVEDLDTPSHQGLDSPPCTAACVVSVAPAPPSAPAPGTTTPGATRLELLLEDRFARLEAKLDSCQRVETKLDALSEAFQFGHRRPSMSHTPSNAFAHHPMSPSMQRHASDQGLTWRAALLERGKSKPIKERRSEMMFDKTSSDITAARRISIRQSAGAVFSQSSLQSSGGHSASEDSASASDCVEHRNSKPSGNSGTRRKSGVECSVGSEPSLMSATAVVPAGSMGSSRKLSEDSHLSKQEIIRLANAELGIDSEAPRSGPRGARNTRTARNTGASMISNLSLNSPNNKAKGGINEAIQTHNKKEMQQKLNRKFTSMKFEESEKNNFLSRIVTHKYFDGVITNVVCINALLIGASVQHNAVSKTETSFFQIAEYICTSIFLVELACRIIVHKKKFITDRHERWWNAFDSFLVFISVVDAVVNIGVLIASGRSQGMPSSAGFMGKLLRIIRMARIMRIVRTVRFLSQLRIMTHMIVSSMMSLFWIFVIIFALIYVFAIILTQGTTEWLSEPWPELDDEHREQVIRDEVAKKYGSLFTTMYTLFQAMSGGVNWYEVAEVLEGPGWGYEAVMVGFMFFCLFAVINIVTGVFVDGAIELAKRDRTVLLQKMAQDTETQHAHLLGLVQALDQDGDESITAEEFRRGLEKAEVRDFISAMQVEISDAEQFFAMLDEDGSGEVDLVEFVQGMQRLRGEAKSVDIHMMLHENKKMLKMVNGLVDYFESMADMKEAEATEDGSPKGFEMKSVITEDGDAGSSQFRSHASSWGMSKSLS